jgi:signal transduction histidine kinase
MSDKRAHHNPTYSAPATSPATALRGVEGDVQPRRRPTAPADELTSGRYSPEMLSIISHELRSPLAAIKGYAATLRRHDRRLSREERGEFLDAIDEASDRLTRIVERILELSQLEMGLVDMVREPVALARLVRESVTAAERRLAASHQLARPFTFRIVEEDVQGALVLADVRYLRDVLDNLLENAITYSPNGGVIGIHLAPLCQDLGSGGMRPALELTVSDQGVGIPEEHLTQIFETFQRVDTRSTRETEGIGLGLAICREIVDRHEGLLWAENGPDGGSVFHVVLPTVEETGEKTSRATERRPTPADDRSGIPRQSCPLESTTARGDVHQGNEEHR